MAKRKPKSVFIGIFAAVLISVILIAGAADKSTAAKNVVIPDWIKNNAAWWSQELITDIEFASAIEFLINDGIIEVGATQEASAQEPPGDSGSADLSALENQIDSGSADLSALQARISTLENQIASLHIVVTPISETKELPAGGEVEVNPTCPPDTVVLGGGYIIEHTQDGKIFLHLDEIDLNRHDIKVKEKAGWAGQFTGVAYCVEISP